MIETICKSIESIFAVIMLILSIALIIIGAVGIANDDLLHTFGYTENNNLSVASLAFGCILLAIVIASFVAICSGKRKC